MRGARFEPGGYPPGVLSVPVRSIGMPGQTAGWDRLGPRLRSAAPPQCLPAVRPAVSGRPDPHPLLGPLSPPP